MGHNFFQRRPRPDAEASDFAATVASLPADAEPETSLPPAPDSIPSPVETSTPGTPSDFAGDSLPALADVEAAVEHSPTLSNVGRYALKGPLGQGGLGEVHEAWDPLLSRTVAVKTLQFDLEASSRESLDGLILNEARAAAGLNHPHIVTIHDAGLSERGVYIAMERLRGRDLRCALAEGWRPTPGEAALLVRRVADALAYAHGRGVVHCDIKPANIFLSKHERPKVLDFGIARVAHGAAVPALEGLVAGSPHYLAPEQLRGGKVDARTDIHALGVVFYELLTGRKAFHGDTLEQITNAVLTNHPAPAHEVRPGVPPTLSQIAATAMARDPDERYANAAQMAADLRRWIDRHTTATSAASAKRTEAARVPKAAAPLPKPPAARRSGALWAAAALAGMLLLGAVWLGLRNGPGKPEPAVVVAAPAAPAAAVTTPLAAPMAAPMVAPEPEAASAAAPSPIGAPDLPAAAVTAKPARAKMPATTPGRGAATRGAAIAAAPVAAATGLLQFAISPWGQIEVDGAAAGTTPPLTQLTLAEGAHTITVRNADFAPFTATVQVSADKPVTVRHRFGP